MEDYKTLYEQMLKRAKEEIKKCGYNKGRIRMIENIIPELKESENEKIRKELIRAFTATADKRDCEIYGNGITYRQVLAWLEKQNEQKSEELPNGEELGIDSLYHAVRILEKTLGEVEGYQSDDGILEHKCAIEAVKRLYEQKSTWSEEDEKLLNLSLENLTELRNRFGEEYGRVGDCISWLKSLKERMKGE